MKGVLIPAPRHAEIRELHRNRTPVHKIVEKFNLHIATIYWILEEKKGKKKKRGRPPKLTSLQRLQLQTKMSRNPTESVRKLANSLKFPASERTLR